MKPQFVLLLCDVSCKWGDEPISYRVFVDDELFAERTFIWRDEYLEENLQILAPPGQYRVTFVNLNPERGTMRVKNCRVEKGHAREHKGVLEIFDENT